MPPTSEAPIGTSPTITDAASGPEQSTDDFAARIEESNPAGPALGSMQSELLTMTDAARGQIFALTIGDAGFQCPSVQSAKAVGNTGSVWRAHCGEVLVYWVEVNDFGRLSVRPVPYGDFWPGTLPTREVQPELRLDRQDRTLERIDPRLERTEPR